MIWSSWISRLSAILILRYSPSKKTTSFVSYCFSKPTFTHISGSKCPILMGFSPKYTLCDVVEDHAEISELNVTDLRQILLDHITYIAHKHYAPKGICWCKNLNVFEEKWGMRLWITKWTFKLLNMLISSFDTWLGIHHFVLLSWFPNRVPLSIAALTQYH